MYRRVSLFVVLLAALAASVLIAFIWVSEEESGGKTTTPPSSSESHTPSVPSSPPWIRRVVLRDWVLEQQQRRNRNETMTPHECLAQSEDARIALLSHPLLLLSNLTSSSTERLCDVVHEPAFILWKELHVSYMINFFHSLHDVAYTAFAAVRHLIGGGVDAERRIEAHGIRVFGHNWLYEEFESMGSGHVLQHVAPRGVELLVGLNVACRCFLNVVADVRGGDVFDWIRASDSDAQWNTARNATLAFRRYLGHRILDVEYADDTRIVQRDVCGGQSPMQVVIAQRLLHRRHFCDLNATLAEMSAFPTPRHVVRVLDMYELDERETMQVLREAHVLVGVHGAAMANVLFMRPGATMVEIFPPENCVWENGALYQNAANMLRVQYIRHCLTAGAVVTHSNYDPIVQSEVERFRYAANTSAEQQHRLFAVANVKLSGRELAQLLRQAKQNACANV